MKAGRKEREAPGHLEARVFVTAFADRPRDEIRGKYGPNVPHARVSIRSGCRLPKSIKHEVLLLWGTPFVH